MLLQNSINRGFQIWITASGCLVALACSDAGDSTLLQSGLGGSAGTSVADSGGSTWVATTGGAQATTGGTNSVGGSSAAQTATGGSSSSASGGQMSGGASASASGGATSTTSGGSSVGGTSTGGQIGSGGSAAKPNGGSSAGGSVTGGTAGKALGGTSTGGATSKSTGGASTGTGGQAVGGAAGASSAPTWTQLYTKYLAPGTIGHCGECHSKATSATAAYDFLRTNGQISATNGASSSLTVQGKSKLVWFGGDMPDGGKAGDASAQVLADFRAWVAAGAKNN